MTLNRPGPALAAVAVAAALFLPACGGDVGAQRRALGGDKPVKVEVSTSSIEVTRKVTAGAVRFNFVSLVDEGDLNIARVKPGTDIIEFKEGVAKMLTGGP